MLCCSHSDVSLNLKICMWNFEMRSCDGKLPRKLLDVLTVTSKIRVFHEEEGGVGQDWGCMRYQVQIWLLSGMTLRLYLD